MTLILASGSITRQRLLSNAGLFFKVLIPPVDETKIKQQNPSVSGAELASKLAEAKAIAASREHPTALIIAADQVLELAGQLLGKPRTPGEARAQLKQLRGNSHELVSAVCCAKDGQPLWRYSARAKLAMREFTDKFLDDYLCLVGNNALASVGAYQLEGMGVQLFDTVEGDHFTILGLPLLPLLQFLRSVGEITE